MVLPSHTSPQSGNDVEVVDIHDYFDSKYKVIVGKKMTIDYLEIIEWLNKNSNGSVDIKILDVEKTSVGWINSSNKNNIIFVAFENADDCLFFKIKYPDNILYE